MSGASASAALPFEWGDASGARSERPNLSTSRSSASLRQYSSGVWRMHMMSVPVLGLADLEDVLLDFASLHSFEPSEGALKAPDPLLDRANADARKLVRHVGRSAFTASAITEPGSQPSLRVVESPPHAALPAGAGRLA